MNHTPPRTGRREFLGGAAAALGMSCSTTAGLVRGQEPDPSKATLVGSSNALAGMQLQWERLAAGAAPLDVAIEVVKVTEANPKDHSVGLGGLPNEDGVVQLDAAVMDGPTHNAGSVACLEGILHPSEVARLVMERTDHCMLVGEGAYSFARSHGHPHTELLTEEARALWMRWKESMSATDDRLPPPAESGNGGNGGWGGEDEEQRITGTIHCSALSVRGELACTTTTSGLAYKIPGRVGDSPLIGAGLYCDQDVGSAGSTGRGEAVILSTGSAAIVEALRRGASPEDAGLEVLERIERQAQRAAAWQPGLVDERGVPTFNVKFYVVDRAGRTAGLALRGRGKYAVANVADGPHLEQLVALHP